MRRVMAIVAALAERLQILPAVVGRVVAQMSDRQDDPYSPDNRATVFCIASKKLGTVCNFAPFAES